MLIIGSFSRKALRATWLSVGAHRLRVQLLHHFRAPQKEFDECECDEVWSQQLSVSQQDAGQQLYLRMVLHSDYISSDLRFQVKFEGRQVADNQVTAHGYADMIGPLDAGSYQWLACGIGFSKLLPRGLLS